MSSSQSHPTRPRRFPRVVLLVSVAVLLIFGGLAVWRIIQHRAVVQREAAALKQLRNAGIPTNRAELDQFVRLPPDVPNLTDDWVELFEQQQEISNQLFHESNGKASDGLPWYHELKTWTDLPPVGTLWSREKQCEEYLQHFDEVIVQSRSTAIKRGLIFCDIDTNLDDNKVYSLRDSPFTDGMYRAVQLLALDSYYQARRGADDLALADLEAAFLLIDSGRFAPGVDSIQPLQTFHSLVSVLAARLSTTDHWLDAELQRLQAAIAAVNFRMQLKRAYMGDVGRNLTLLDMNVTGWAKDWLTDSRALYSELMLPIITDLDNDWPNVSGSYSQYGDKLNEITNDRTLRSHYKPAMLIFPATGMLLRETANAVTRQKAAIIALACERQRRSTGTYPNSIAELDVQWLPKTFSNIDPFTGDPLLITTEAGLTVYGRASNKLDDGGQIEAAEWEYPLDVGIEVAVHR